MPAVPSRSVPTLIVAIPLVAILIAGCGGGQASPSPQPEPTAPAGAKALLRVTMVQALPPAATFGWVPQLVISLDGRVLTGGAVPAIFPGPLVQPVVERRITPNGWSRIVAAAREAGLLSGAQDFTGGEMPPGSQTARLELIADGRAFDIRGDPSRVMVCVTAPCNPPPGTPEAFGGFLNRLSDLASWVGPELGPEALHNPAGYAIVVGPAPDEQGLPQPPLDWPVAGGFARFGAALADGSGGRCGIVTGAEAVLLRPMLGAATQITKWRDPADGSFHGLAVRPLLPGDEDPCSVLV